MENFSIADITELLVEPRWNDLKEEGNEAFKTQ